MRNKHVLILDIPDPCLENWAEMTPCEQGRFCLQCQKEVIDFTGWSDAALFRFFETHEGPVCGRMHKTQLNRPVILPPQKSTLLYQAVLTLGLVLVLGSGAELHARPRPPLAQYNLTDSIRVTEGDSTAIVFKGVVLDEQNKPVEGVCVFVKEKGILKGGAMTDEDGKYTVTINSSAEIASFDLEFSYAEYMRRVIRGNDQSNWHRVVMKRNTAYELSTGIIIRARPPLDKTETYDPKRFGY